ncbi:MAG: pilus assembly protein TadG-related protein [Gaiellaceae bacterium]
MSPPPAAPPAGDRQSGQVAVLTVLFLVVLLGMCAAVLDVGSWYRADRALQSTVDAAALAGAQALPDDPAFANSLALEYAEKNGGGGESVSIESELLADDTILVTGARPAPAFFTKLFGLDEVQVAARAKVRASTIEEARWAAPFGVDEQHPMLQCRCFDEETDLQLEKVGPGAFRLINVDGSHGGTGPPILADWIERGYEGYMPLGWYYSDPGAKFNSSHVKDALDARLDTEMLFPVYRNTRGGGANFEYEVVGWAGYVITSYEIKGSKNNKLFGHFTSVVWEGIGSETAEAPDFGAHVLSLVE